MRTEYFINYPLETLAGTISVLLAYLGRQITLKSLAKITEKQHISV